MICNLLESLDNRVKVKYQIKRVKLFPFTLTQGPVILINRFKLLRLRLE